MRLLESSPAAQGAGITRSLPVASARVRPSKSAGGRTTTHFARSCLLPYKVRAIGNESLVLRAPQRRDLARRCRWPHRHPLDLFRDYTGSHLGPMLHRERLLSVTK